jgi:hypothetical protein
MWCLCARESIRQQPLSSIISFTSSSASCTLPAVRAPQHCAACFLTFYEEVLPPQFRALIPSVSKGCLQPYMIFQVGTAAAGSSGSSSSSSCQLNCSCSGHRGRQICVNRAPLQQRASRHAWLLKMHACAWQLRRQRVALTAVKPLLAACLLLLLLLLLPAEPPVEPPAVGSPAACRRGEGRHATHAWQLAAAQAAAASSTQLQGGAEVAVSGHPAMHQPLAQ